LRQTEGIDIKREFNRACQYYQSGDPKGAEAICRKIVSVQPDDPNALNLLGLIAHQLGENEMAINLMSRAIRNDPENPFLYNNLGAVFHDSGKFPEAISSYKKAIHIKPDCADAYNNMGLVFQEQGKVDEAISCYQEALQLRTHYPEANYNLGNALKESGKLAEAIQCYQKAVALRPDYPEACNNMGNAFNDQGKFDEAVACLKRAVTLRPDFPEAHYNLGNALHGMVRLEEAIVSYERALELRPDYPEAYNNLGIVFKNCGHLGKAIECYKTSLGLKPDFSKVHSDFLLAMNYDPSICPEGIFLESSDWWHRHGEPHTNKFCHKDHKTFGRLRIGYVSPDFRGHSVSYFFLPLLMAHDRNEVEVFCYAEVKRPDEMTVRIRDLSDHWRSTVGLGDDAVAQKIYEDRIDILVDLAGHTANNRLPVFARKPAPVQVTWLGYPGTTGLPVMDYRLTDEIADPEGDGDQHYSETLVRLKNGFLCYLPPDGAPDVASLPALESGRITFGSFNNLPKLNEGVLEIWSEILLQVPGSFLLIKSRQLADKSTKRRYRDLFINNGVTPDRVRTLPATSSISEHLELYNRVDIALDPFPYNGTTTTCEALWMGVPVVTLRGKSHSSRVGASILTRVGLKELVAEAENNYVSKGVSLTRDLGRLKALRKGLRRRMKASNLCDAGSFARSIEGVYRKIDD
jgi:protein O-GlcNAc transferase